MDLNFTKNLFDLYREKNLYHRYITNEDILPILQSSKSELNLTLLGKSVLEKSIYSFMVGSGSKHILMWSQMHGNESTTTKAVFDILNTLTKSKYSAIQKILLECTICVIPILNPDGAEAYTRVNANNIDLNRDAQYLSQPESLILNRLFQQFKPDYCYNLHGQRTIFSAGKTNNSAIVSFLAPAQDEQCTITPNRKVSMEIITRMNEVLQKEIPGNVGVYDDTFNINCVGDTFQKQGIPTILFEAGHFPGDYEREKTRKLIYSAMLESLLYITNNKITGANYKSYLDIPENQKLFFDIIIRNAKLNGENDSVDIAIQYQEILKDRKIHFLPRVEKIQKLENFYGHKELDANGALVSWDNNKGIRLNDENDFVIVNNEKISLLTK